MSQLRQNSIAVCVPFYVPCYTRTKRIDSGTTVAHPLQQRTAVHVKASSLCLPANCTQKSHSPDIMNGDPVTSAQRTSMAKGLEAPNTHTNRDNDTNKALCSAITASMGRPRFTQASSNDRSVQNCPGGAS